jgi:hypothetical protein
MASLILYAIARRVDPAQAPIDFKARGVLAAVDHRPDDILDLRRQLLRDPQPPRPGTVAPQVREAIADAHQEELDLSAPEPA